jgi:hypothetical protein
MPGHGVFDASRVVKNDHVDYYGAAVTNNSEDSALGLADNTVTRRRPPAMAMALRPEGSFFPVGDRWNYPVPKVIGGDSFAGLSVEERTWRTVTVLPKAILLVPPAAAVVRSENGERWVLETPKAAAGLVTAILLVSESRRDSVLGTE